MAQTKAQRSAAAKKAAETRRKKAEAATEADVKPNPNAGESPQPLTGEGTVVEGEDATGREPVPTGSTEAGEHLIVTDATKPEGDNQQSIVVQSGD